MKVDAILMNVVAISEVRSRGKTAKNQKKKKEKYSGQQQKEMDCDEPHLVSNEKM